MTCRGYDPRAVKISKSVKRLAAQYLDPHQRGAIIRSYVQIAQEQMRSKGRREKSE